MAYNYAVETFRDKEYPMLKGKVYLDHGGTTIYAKSLISSFSDKLLCNLYGNPHSNSDPSQLSSRVVDATREAVLEFFGADPEHFDLIFTANATAAIKLVGETFKDLAEVGSRTGSFFYGYHLDSHTSLVGVRELTNGTHHCFTSDEEVESWLVGDTAQSHTPSVAGLPGLFAYPGQSNMTGRRLPLSWTKKLRQSTLPHHQNTYSLLDAAALATTCQIDFSDPDAAPDFTAVSFYKIFGFPDLGGLIVRKTSGHILSWRRYFGGGTVSLVTVLHETTVQRREDTLHEGLEDGTLPFHNIIALKCAIDVHKKLYTSMATISQHTSFLAQRLYDGMAALHHHNGNPVCIIHNDFTKASYKIPQSQGSTVSFSVLSSSGSFIEHSFVEKLANEEGIYVRSGGLCNAGGIARHLQIEPWQFKRAWSSGFRCGGEVSVEVIHGKPIGVVRVGLGAMSTISDVDTFLTFMMAKFQSCTSDNQSAKFVQHKSQTDVGKPTGHFQTLEGYQLVRTDSGFHSRSRPSTTESSFSSPKTDIPLSSEFQQAGVLRRTQHPNHRDWKVSNATQCEYERSPPLGGAPQPRHTVSAWGLRDRYRGKSNARIEVASAGQDRHLTEFTSTVDAGQSNVDNTKKLRRFRFWTMKKSTSEVASTSQLGV